MKPKAAPRFSSSRCAHLSRFGSSRCAPSCRLSPDSSGIKEEEFGPVPGACSSRCPSSMQRCTESIHAQHTLRNSRNSPSRENQDTQSNQRAKQTLAAHREFQTKIGICSSSKQDKKNEKKKKKIHQHQIKSLQGKAKSPWISSEKLGTVTASLDPKLSLFT